MTGSVQRSEDSSCIRHRSLQVGATGFEPATLWSQTRCASQTALRPESRTADRVPHKRKYGNRTTRFAFRSAGNVTAGWLAGGSPHPSPLPEGEGARRIPSYCSRLGKAICFDGCLDGLPHPGPCFRLPGPAYMLADSLEFLVVAEVDHEFAPAASVVRQLDAASECGPKLLLQGGDVLA